MSEKILLSGNEAIARGAWEAGCTFGSGYPGTPSSEILPALTRLGEVYTEWAPNEKGALEAASGASLTGARCLATMKHVGLNVAADPFFTLSYTGVTGGLVIVCADDPHMHSSQNEQDNRHFARAAKVPLLEPADAQEAYEMTKQAFALSEAFDTPVMLRVTTRLSHSDGVVSVGERAAPPPCGLPEKNPEKYVMIPGRARARRKVIAERTRQLREAPPAGLNRLEAGDPALGIITSGIAYQYAREAAPGASFLKLGLTWPLPEALIHDFAATVSRLVVIEELDLYLTGEVRALGLTVEALPESLQLGELSPARVRAALQGSDVPAAAGDDLPSRPPQLCAGCPHRGVFHALRQLKVFVTGDIGCYTLGTLPPLQALHTCLCMGGGIGQVHGLNQACGGAQRAVAVIGDSTFVHSGLTGLINIVYNQSPSVVIILDNATTAMTGGQDHPGTGQTLRGIPGGQLDLAAICRAVGVRQVEIFDPADLAATTNALKAALDAGEPAVLIARRPCVLIDPHREPAYRVAVSRCIQCGACLRLGCPAISATVNEAGKRRPVIDATLCTGCRLCAQVCPKAAIVNTAE